MTGPVAAVAAAGPVIHTVSADDRGELNFVSR